MANVMFKRGTQSALNALNNYVDGAFYLTTDTDRLYVAQSSSELVELNKSITVVNSLADLPLHTNDTATGIKGNEVAVGQFYYVKAGAGSVSGNILAVCSAIADGTITWTQVNPDTNTNNNDDTSIFSVGVAEITDTTDSAYVANQITYRITIQERKTDLLTNTDYTAPAAKTAVFSIDPSDIANVGLTSTAVQNNAVTLSATGNGSDSTHNVTITAGAGITFTGTTADNIQINALGNTYTMSSPDVSGATDTNTANIVLTDGSNNNAGTVAIKSGTNLAIDNSVAGEITIKHAAAGNTGAANKGPAANVTASAIGAQASTINVPQISYDAQGHVTTDSDNKTLTINPITTVGVGSVDPSMLVLTDAANSTISSAAHTLSYEIGIADSTGTVTTSTIDNQGNLGTFYNKTAIDAIIKDKFNNLNPLIYKGTVGSSGSSTGNRVLPTSNVAIGDVYLVDSDGFIQTGIDGNDDPVTVYSSKGDLYIAQAAAGESEDADTGYLDADDIVWTRVESGADVDTQYELSSGAGSSANQAIISLAESNGAQTAAGSVGIHGNGNITVGYANDVITIGHAAKFGSSSIESNVYGTEGTTTGTIAATATPAHGETINIPGLKIDVDGHITAIGNTAVTLPSETTYDLDSPANSTAISLKGNGSAIATVTLTQENNGDVVLTGTTEDEIHITHKTYTVGNPTDATTSADTKGYGGTITALTGLTISNGHVSALETKTFTLPGAQTVSDAYTSVTRGVQEVSSLDSVAYSTKQYISDSLTISNSVSNDINHISFEIEWGTF